MSFKIGRPLLVLCSWIVLAGAGRGQDVVPNAGPACRRDAVEDFEKGVWDNVAAARCLQCHRPGGEAEESGLVLQDIRKLRGRDRDEAMRRNREAFARLAREEEGGRSRLLAKPTGGLDHGGGEVLKPGSKGYLILEAFVRRIDGRPAPTTPIADDRDRPPFFDGVAMLDAKRLLRRVTLSLAGRLPTPSETAAVAEGGLDRLPPLLDALMNEDAFYDRLREGFNDIFLTLGIDGNAEATVLSYEHFEKTRLWDQKYDLGHVPEKDRQKARYKLADDYRKALLGEPMKLIEHIVRNDRPFTEVVTADYIMVTPYSARGYGVFEEVRARVQEPRRPVRVRPGQAQGAEGAEPVRPTRSRRRGPTRTRACSARSSTCAATRPPRRTGTGCGPGCSTSTSWASTRWSWPPASRTPRRPRRSTRSRRCRPRNAWSATGRSTRWPGCSRTSTTSTGVYGRRKGGWYEDMFPAGFEGEDVAGRRALAGAAMARRADREGPPLRGRDGRARLLPAHRPQGPAAAEGPGRPAPCRPAPGLPRAAPRRSRRSPARFARSGFNLKEVFKDWIVSDFYRADGLATALDDPARRAELEDAGLVRHALPRAAGAEDRGRLRAALGPAPGGRDGDPLRRHRLAGGHRAGRRPERGDGRDPAHPGQRDRQPAHPERFRPEGPANAGSSRASSPTSCPAPRPRPTPRSAAPSSTCTPLILGRDEAEDSEDVARTFDLFAGIVADAAGRKGLDRREIYHARRERSDVPDDPHYTIRAWRAVVTYLLRRPEFLYE